MKAAIAAAAGAFSRWRETSVADRSSRLIALGGAIAGRSPELQRLITEEVSKTLRSSAAELTKCAVYTRWLSGNASRILAARSAGSAAHIHYEPLGVVAGIMPWNFPFWQVIRFAAAALVAGNAVVVKHSPLVPRCAEALNDVFAAAGFDRDVFFCAAGSSDDARILIADDRVRAVAFTGSSETGRQIASLAGQHLKKCILELGGSDAFIVMASANLEVAVHAAVESRLRAGGQACTAAKRFLVHSRIADEFEARLVEAMNAIKVGDPFDPAIDIGPLVTETAANRLQRKVDDSIPRGATVLCGAQRLGARMYQPTVLAVRDVHLPVMQEETFGPVAPVLRVNDIDEAVAAANSTRYGLSASVWTTDTAEAAALRVRLDAGQVFVNCVTSSNVDLPFGGTKDSGFGRELGDAGLLEFVNVKVEVRAQC